MKKFFKKKAENNDIYFKLHVDFGYWEDSPIPSKKQGKEKDYFVITTNVDHQLSNTLLRMI